MLLSFVFRRIDLRNRALIKNAEAALIAYELGHVPDDGKRELPPEYLFANERRHADARKMERGRLRRIGSPESYSEGFDLLFWAFGVAGLAFVLSAAL
jgi:hypothetical protein